MLVNKSHTDKPKILPPILPNLGVCHHYQRALQEMIVDMHISFEYWVTATYRQNPPRLSALIAQDGTPSDATKKVIAALAKKWIKKFDESAEKVAYGYIKSMFDASDIAFQKALKDAGWAVKFTMTPAVKDAFTASLNENISLIKSIPVQYAQELGGIVMRSYTAGRDLETMVREIKQLYPKAANRAELIARDQSNKANSVCNRTRQMELGIVKAKWLHSHAGKQPRPSHVRANGKIYNIAEGCLIDGEYIQPGFLINCRCSCRPILPY
jgi:SPP1 gp7 family putative phage head morphogenesis protein